MGCVPLSVCWCILGLIAFTGIHKEFYSLEAFVRLCTQVFCYLFVNVLLPPGCQQLQNRSWLHHKVPSEDSAAAAAATTTAACRTSWTLSVSKSVDQPEQKRHQNAAVRVFFLSSPAGSLCVTSASPDNCGSSGCRFCSERGHFEMLDVCLMQEFS